MRPGGRRERYGWRALRADVAYLVNASLQRLTRAEWSENWRAWPHCCAQDRCWMHVERRWCRCPCRWCYLAARYRPGALRALGWARTQRLRWLTTRAALARRIRREELRWSGKRLAPDDVATLVNALKGWIPW